MEALIERLTTTEAAVAAGVSVPQINRIIDEKILPEDLYSTSPTRSLACGLSVGWRLMRIEPRATRAAQSLR